MILFAILLAWAPLACRHRELHGDRSPFAAANGVSRADPAAGRSFRVLPLKAIPGDVEILSGDPERPGEPFVMRIFELPGTKIPPHRHPVDENVTVVQGTWYFGTGEKWDRAAMKELRAGDYAFAPKGCTMFGYCADGAVVQVHGIGPFRIDWIGGLQTLDEPGTSSPFTFRKGERVEAARGRGTVRQGYASGEILQYEIQADAGGRFMADPEELRRL